MKIDASYWNKENFVILLSNILLVIGMLLFGWEPLSVFVLYILESIIIGIIHALKMFAIGVTGKEEGSMQKLIFYIPFFLFHFMFFVFVQSAFVMPQDGNSFFGGFLKLFTYVHGTFLYWLLAVAVFNVYIMFKDLLFNERYKQVSLDKVMFEPYPRIFVQQFTVILGSGLFMFTNSYWGLLVVFIIVKTIAEIAVAQSQFVKQQRLIGEIEN